MPGLHGQNPCERAHNTSSFKNIPRHQKDRRDLRKGPPWLSFDLSWPRAYSVRGIFLFKNCLLLFWGTPTARGSPWAKDRTCAAAVSRATVVTMPDPDPTEPQGNPPRSFFKYYFREGVGRPRQGNRGGVGRGVSFEPQSDFDQGSRAP